MTPSTASFRALNSEYTKNEAKRKEATAKLAIFGGAFSLDRVIIETAGAVDELDFQVKQKIEAARNLFHWALINGDNGNINRNRSNRNGPLHNTEDDRQRRRVP